MGSSPTARTKQIKDLASVFISCLKFQFVEVNGKSTGATNRRSATNSPRKPAFRACVLSPFIQRQPPANNAPRARARSRGPLPRGGAGITVAAMAASASSMVIVLPFLTSNATIRRLRISLPLVTCLLDGQKYFSPGDLPPLAGDDLRPMLRPRLTRTPFRWSPNRDPALVKDSGNAARAGADFAVESPGDPAALAQHLSDRDPAGGGGGPGSEAAPFALVDPL